MDLYGFAKVCKDLQGIARIVKICIDLQGLAMISKDLHFVGSVRLRSCKVWQGSAKICKDLSVFISIYEELQGLLIISK